VWVQPSEYATLGSCLAEVRKAAGITQDELAALLEKPQSFVSAYERGQRRVDVLELLLILRAIKADPEAVFAKIAALPYAAAKQRPRSRRRPARQI
jgi:transcriptional regulator with XRE-family HTH domain